MARARFLCLALSSNSITNPLYRNCPPYHHINVIPMRLFMTRADFGPISLPKKLIDKSLEHSEIC